MLPGSMAACPCIHFRLSGRHGVWFLALLVTPSLMPRISALHTSLFTPLEFCLDWQLVPFTSFLYIKQKKSVWHEKVPTPNMTSYFHCCIKQPSLHCPRHGLAISRKIGHQVCRGFGRSGQQRSGTNCQSV